MSGDSFLRKLAYHSAVIVERPGQRPRSATEIARERTEAYREQLKARIEGKLDERYERKLEADWSGIERSIAEKWPDIVDTCTTKYDFGTSTNPWSKVMIRGERPQIVPALYWELQLPQGHGRAKCRHCDYQLFFRGDVPLAMPYHSNPITQAACPGSGRAIKEQPLFSDCPECSAKRLLFSSSGRLAHHRRNLSLQEGPCPSSQRSVGDIFTRYFLEFEHFGVLDELVR